MTANCEHDWYYSGFDTSDAVHKVRECDVCGQVEQRVWMPVPEPPPDASWLRFERAE